MNNYMFGDKKNKIKDSERSLISETVSIEGTINSSGAIDVAGLVKGPVIFGWIFSAHQFGSALAAYGAGLSRDSLLSYLPAFIIAGMFCFFALILIVIFKVFLLSNPKVV